MAMRVNEIREWLDTLDGDQEVGVDEGGLCLRVVDDPVPWLEIGGLPDDEDGIWEGTEGQDRESYSDDQDRECYT